ncbi:Holliday junction resolvase RuvX [Thalassotalea crassostreae]|uniref:Holliday junction resolvase RuvX n=1 Tax=Thalassotalea crassostreae TaxID=1763536 RepID=UPI00083940AB|nr:Holliday junction resolvase RuvX [Thalassotalea crassostreae]
MAKSSKDKGMRTILGFDFGTKYIGVAVGQEITGSASPVRSVKAKDGVPNWDNIETIIREWEPDLLVVGLPLNMDGSEQLLTKRARKFGNRMSAKFSIHVDMQDERLTTADAKAELFERGGYRNLQKDNIDCQSAVIILQSYMAE